MLLELYRTNTFFPADIHGITVASRANDTMQPNTFMVPVIVARSPSPTQLPSCHLLPLINRPKGSKAWEAATTVPGSSSSVTRVFSRSQATFHRLLLQLKCSMGRQDRESHTAASVERSKSCLLREGPCTRMWIVEQPKRSRHIVMGNVTLLKQAA